MTVEVWIVDSECEFPSLQLEHMSLTDAKALVSLIEDGMGFNGIPENRLLDHIVMDPSKKRIDIYLWAQE